MTVHSYQMSLIDLLIDWLIDWPVDWLIDCFIVCLIDWLIDWLIIDWEDDLKIPDQHDVSFHHIFGHPYLPRKELPPCMCMALGAYIILRRGRREVQNSLDQCFLVPDQKSCKIEPYKFCFALLCFACLFVILLTV